MKLSDFELEVMGIMWRSGPITAPEIHREIGRSKKVSYSTVKTIIDRLEEKGAVARERTYGRTILYRTKVQREALSKPMISSFVRKLFGGNVRPLFNYALDEENITLEDIAYLEGIIASKKKNLESEDV